MKTIGINLKKNVLRIDSRGNIEICGGNNQRNEDSLSLVQDEYCFYDVARLSELEMVDGDSTGVPGLNIESAQQGFVIETFGEVSLFSVKKSSFTYLSGRVSLLKPYFKELEDKDAVSFIEEAGFFHPFKTLISDVFCLGYYQRIVFSSANIERAVSLKYMRSFVGAKSTRRPKRYVERVLETLKSRLKGFDEIVINQSGMDSALMTAALSKVLPITGNQPAIEALHVDLSGKHWLGDYQKSVVTGIQEKFPEIRACYLEPSTDTTVFAKADIRFIAPSEVFRRWSTDGVLHQYISNNKLGRTCLILQGDRTGLHQPFNGTLMYRVAPLSNLRGFSQRFLFGRWFAVALFFLYRCSGKNVQDAYSFTSYSLLARSITGSYTAKIPNLRPLFSPRRTRGTRLFTFLSFLSSNYSLVERDRQAMSGFHSFVRDQLLYSIVQRNLDSCLLCDHHRVTFLSDISTNEYVSLFSQSLAELAYPKLGIRRRLYELGLPIDSIVDLAHENRPHPLRVYKIWLKEVYSIVRHSLFRK